MMRIKYLKSLNNIFANSKVADLKCVFLSTTNETSEAHWPTNSRRLGFSFFFWVILLGTPTPFSMHRPPSLGKLPFWSS